MSGGSVDNLTLVTGASGFIGGHIAKLLSDEGRSLRLFLREKSQTKYLKGVEFQTAYGDLRNGEAVKSAMQGVDTVYHVAALFALWTKNRQDFFDINVTGTRNICEAALAAGVKKFVYTSTTGAVGISDSPNKLCNEKTVWNRGWTNDPYTLSKYEAEQVVLEYVQKGLPAVILNPTGPIGPGDVYPTPTGKMICDFVKGTVPFYVDAHFSMVDVRDAALGHRLAEERGVIGERYILCGENLSALELLTQLATIVGKKPPKIKLPHAVLQSASGILEWVADHITHKPPLITKPYAKLMPLYFWFDNSKSKKELGLKYRSVQTGLKDAVKWFQENGYA